MNLQEIINATFGSLTHPEQIANLCRERHIQGFVGHFTSCPMVKLVREQIDLPVGFTMGKKFGQGRWVVAYFDKQVSLPAHLVCEQFADGYDSGAYKDLVSFNKENEDEKGSADSTSSAVGLPGVPRSEAKPSDLPGECSGG